MSTLYVLDGNGAGQYIAGSGAGTTGDPFVGLYSLSGLPSGNLPIGQVTFVSPQTVLAQQSGPWSVGISGSPSVNTLQSGPWSVAISGGLPAGTNSIGTVSLSSTIVGVSGTPSVQQQGAWSVSVSGAPSFLTSCTAVVANSMSRYRTTWNGSASGVLVKSSNGNLYSYYMQSRAGREVFVKLYDQATTPVSGNVPAEVYSLPPSGGLNLTFDAADGFTNGIGLWVTAGVADNDATTTASGDVVINLWYK